jgi:hypothetical protein
MNDSRAKKGQVYVHPSTIDYYAQQTWKFAKSILWNNVPFLPEEIELSLEYLKDYYRSIPPELFVKVAANYFNEMCERILLAKGTTGKTTTGKHCEHCGNGFTSKRNTKKYCTDNCKQMAYLKRNGLLLSGHKPLKENQHTSQNHNYHIPHPCIWFNPLNLTGIIGTKSWYAKRKRAGKNDK